MYVHRNRLTKSDVLTEWTTYYFYDVHDVETYGSRANRLMKYEVYDHDELLYETVAYRYDQGGSMKEIIRRRDNEYRYHRTYFVYDQQGRTWLTAQDEYDLNTSGTPVNVVKKAVREFRYDATGRQRYLMRDRNTDGELLGEASTHTVWSDYDGEIVYDDLTVDVAAATAYPYPLNGLDVADRASHEPGMLQFTHANTNLMVPLTDHLGTTRMTTNISGDWTAYAVYTAFGEPVDEYGNIGGPPPAALGRYGYVGSEGYEGGSVWGDASSNQLPYLHLGERLYDPTIGRFLQRDPIGIRGGINTFVYVFSKPTVAVDMTGKDIIPMEVLFERVINNRPHRVVPEPPKEHHYVEATIHTAKTLWMFPCAAGADVVCTIFITPIDWVLGTKNYRPGDCTRAVYGRVREWWVN